MNADPYQARLTQAADARADKQKTNNDHPIKITVRTMAGHSRKETVKPDDRVAELTDDAVKHFVNQGDITEGKYALTLPRLSSEAELDPTATVRDAGIIEGDVLVLVSRKPQTDG
jgi:hypothetical protein